MSISWISPAQIFIDPLQKPILSSMKIRWSAARIPASTSPDTPAAIWNTAPVWIEAGLYWNGRFWKRGGVDVRWKNRCHFLNGGESEDVLKILPTFTGVFLTSGVFVLPHSPEAQGLWREATMEMSPVSRGDIKRHLRRGRIGIRNGAFTKKRWDMAYGSTPIIAIFGGRTMKNRPLSSCFRVPSEVPGFDPQKHPGHPNGDADANGWICGGDCSFCCCYLKPLIAYNSGAVC